MDERLEVLAGLRRVLDHIIEKSNEPVGLGHVGRGGHAVVNDLADGPAIGQVLALGLAGARGEGDGVRRHRSCAAGRGVSFVRRAPFCPPPTLIREEVCQQFNRGKKTVHALWAYLCAALLHKLRSQVQRFHFA